MRISGLAATGLGLRLVSELLLFAAFAVSGARLSAPPLVRVVAALVLPAMAVAVWAAWIAPRAARRLPDPFRLLVELVLFVTAAAALAATSSMQAGADLAVLGVVMALVVRRLPESADTVRAPSDRPLSRSQPPSGQSHGEPDVSRRHLGAGAAPRTRQ